MKTHKEKMIKDRDKLESKINALLSYCETKEYTKLSPIKQNILVTHISVMEALRSVLHTRIQIDL